MKPLIALGPADFPGYDAAGITEWLEEVRRARSVLWAMYTVVAGFVVLFSIMEPTLLFVAVILAILVPILAYRRSRNLRVQLNLSHHTIAQARRGELRPVPPAANAPSPAPDTAHAE